VQDTAGVVGVQRRDAARTVFGHGAVEADVDPEPGGHGDRSAVHEDVEVGVVMDVERLMVVEDQSGCLDAGLLVLGTLPREPFGRLGRPCPSGCRRTAGVSLRGRPLVGRRAGGDREQRCRRESNQAASHVRDLPLGGF